MSQNANSTTLPTARKSRRTHHRKRPVLVSSTSQGTDEFQGNQAETLEPESSNVPVHTTSHTETPIIPAVPAQARRASRLPRFFSKVEKTVEESETSQEDVARARLARAQKTAVNTEARPAASATKAQDGKPVQGANRTAASTRPNKLFKTRHFLGMMLYLFGAQLILPLETRFLVQLRAEQVLTQFTVFNFPITITTSVLLNLVTLVLFLYILIKLDLLPTSMTGRTAATTRPQQQRATVDKPAQSTIRQGVKGEHDDLYQAYRSNQRREKKH